MSRRTLAIIGAVIALIVFLQIARSPKKSESSDVGNTPSSHTKPMPAGDPTVIPPPVQEKPKEEEKPKGKPSKDDYEKSSLSKQLREGLIRITTTYASWPGETSRRDLLSELRDEEPLITAGAISKIEDEWANTPVVTFKLTVKNVILDSEMQTKYDGASDATLMAYVTLKKQFTPIGDKPYSEPATQPYLIKLQVIKRSWRVVGIGPYSAYGQNSG